LLVENRVWMEGVVTDLPKVKKDRVLIEVQVDEPYLDNAGKTCWNSFKQYVISQGRLFKPSKTLIPGNIIRVSGIVSPLEWALPKGRQVGNLTNQIGQILARTMIPLPVKMVGEKFPGKVEVNLSGEVAKDPRVKNANGVMAVNFSVIIPPELIDKVPELAVANSAVPYYRVCARYPVAKAVLETIKRGDWVQLYGTLHNRVFAKDGIAIHTWEVDGINFKKLPRPKHRT